MLTKAIKAKVRKLALDGYGDDVIYDATGKSWVAFRIKGFPPLTHNYSILVEHSTDNELAKVRVENAIC